MANSHLSRLYHIAKTLVLIQQVFTGEMRCLPCYLISSKKETKGTQTIDANEETSPTGHGCTDSHGTPQPLCPLADASTHNFTAYRNYSCELNASSVGRFYALTWRMQSSVMNVSHSNRLITPHQCYQLHRQPSTLHPHCSHANTFVKKNF